MSRLRTATRPTAAAAGLLAAGLLLTGCTHGGSSDVVYGGSTGPNPAPTPTGTSSTPAATGTWSDTLLTAADLGTGWSATSAASGDWLTECGDTAGIAKSQQHPVAAAFTGPHQLKVSVRIATYPGSGAADALGAVDAFVTTCPIDDAGGKQSVTSRLDPGSVDDLTGAQTIVTGKSGQTATDSVYWVTQDGTKTLEVLVTATGTDTPGPGDMATFASGVRQAAIAKATGQPVSVVPLPAFGNTGTGDGTGGFSLPSEVPTGIHSAPGGGGIIVPGSQG